MITDLNEIEGDDIQCDICIIGAGAAGITIARILKDEHLDICMLESGGYEYEPDTQSLYKGDIAGVPYFPLDVCRLREFGGSTNHWGGACWPLEPLDFEKKEWIPNSGWPISFEDIEPYYKKAHDFLELGAYNYTKNDEYLSYNKDTKLKTPLDLSYKYLSPKFYKTTPLLRFKTRFKESLQDQENLRVYLHANVIDLKRHDTSEAIESVTITTLSGKKRNVFAKHFILATGGIENGRILLGSYRQQDSGIGNQNDMVGRYFIEHILMPATSSLLLVPRQSIDYFVHHRLSDKIGVRGGLGLREKTIIDERMLNTWFGMELLGGPMLYDTDKMGERMGVKQEIAIKTSKEIQSYISIKQKQLGRVHEAQNIKGASIVVNTTCIAEQSPNPNSRIYLSAEKDRLGIHKSVLDWQLTTTDYASLVKAHTLLGRELGVSSAGRLLLNISQDEETWSSAENIAKSGGVYGSHHHMGTTRMARSAKQGVVDGNCLVYGTSNLYIAGSSVFPTVGYANPTLTIIALAYKLVDHIKKETR